MKPKNRLLFTPRILLAVFCAASSALIFSTSAHAAPLTWTGATGTTWDTGFGSVPTSSDDLTIKGPGNVLGALNIDVAANAFASTISFTNTTVNATTLTNVNDADKTLTIAGSGTAITTTTGAVTIGSATLNQGVNIALGASQTWSVGSGGLTVNNVISGSGFGITKTGTGALTVAGVNTYNGTTTVSAGTLTFGSGGSSASSAVTVGQGTGTGSATKLIVSAPAAAGTTQRTASLTWNGGGFATANNATNFSVTSSAAGNTIEQFGALTLNPGLMQASLVGSTTNVRVVFDSVTRNAGSFMALGHGSSSGLGGADYATATTAANMVFTATTGLGMIGNGGASNTADASIIPWMAGGGTNLSYAMTYDANKGVTAATRVSMATALASPGTYGQNANISTTTLSGTANKVNSLSGPNAVGPYTISFNSDSDKLTVSSGFIGVGGANIVLGNGTNNGIIDFGTSEGFLVTSNNRGITANSAIAGSGGLTIVLQNATTTGTPVVLNGANTFTGVTRILGNYGTTSMTTRLTNSLALQNSTLDYNNYGGAFTFGNGGTTGQTAYTFGGLKGAQNINLNNNNTSVGAVALTVGGNNDSTTYSGVLSNTVAGGSLIKTGTGTLELTGINTYTGATNVNGGKLTIATGGTINGTSGVIIAGGEFNYNSSTALSQGVSFSGTGGKLSGNGTINLAVNVTTGNTLAIGNSVGQMNFGDTLGLNGTTVMEVDGTVGAGATGGHDFANLTGAGAAGVITYGGSMTLDMGVIFTTGSYTWNLFDFASETGTFVPGGITLADQYSGTLLDADLNGVWDLTSGNNTWQFTESTGVLGLTVVPEPDVAALLGSLGVLCLLRRRKA